MSSYLNSEQWNKVIEYCKSSSADTFFLGNMRNNGAGIGFFNEYGNMSLKNCRFYTRPLSAKEIKLNYDTRLAYDEDNI